MPDWLIVAGVTAFIGGVLATRERLRETGLKQDVIHAIVAFGGGILYLTFQDIGHRHDCYSTGHRRWGCGRLQSRYAGIEIDAVKAA